MKKLSNRRYAGALAVALVATSAVSMLTPTSNAEATKSVSNNSIFSIVAKAATPVTISDAADFTTSDNAITGFSQAGLDKVNSADSIILSIPTINGITSIGKLAFSEKFTNKTVEVNIPDNIVEIGEAAFATNSAIKAVKFGTTPASSKLKTIGAKAFYNAGLSKNIQFPDGLETLKDDCFAKNELTSVTLPDNLLIIEGRVFADNKITKADLGKYDKVKAKMREYKVGSNNVIADADTLNVIPYGIFWNNQISSLKDVKFPTSIWGIGESAFANNKFTSLELPAHIHDIFFYGFKDNKLLKKVSFLSKDEGTNFERTYLQIDRGSFQNCAIEGHLEFPAKTNQMGGFSFAGNKITSVDFGPDAPLIGYQSFEGNPITEIYNLNSWGLEWKPFFDTNALKNINFEYKNPKSGERGTFGQSSDNTISLRAFNKGLLKSIKFPSYINTMIFDINGKKYISNAFLENPGWTEGTNKVALYRVASDGATYVTDNALDDSKAKDYIVNPVLVKFVAKDQYGNAVTLSSIKVERTRAIKGAETVTNVTSTAVNPADFKLGDKIKFTIPAAPEGYKMAETPVTGSAITKTADGNYEVTLDPTNAEVVKEVAYGDGYNVGYKETVIEIGYKNLAPEPPKPETPGTPATPGAIQPEKPSTPGAITPESPSTPSTPVTPSTPATPSNPTPSTPATPSNPTPSTPSVPVTPSIPSNPTPSTPTNPSTPNNTIPTVNPPTNVAFTPERIINSDLIPEGNPVFNIVDNNGNSLGTAEVNKDDGTYTFVDDGRTPQGIAKINKDNSLEVVKVFDGKTPKGTLPTTGGSSENGLVLLGFSLLGLGAIFRRKIK